MKVALQKVYNRDKTKQYLTIRIFKGYKVVKGKKIQDKSRESTGLFIWVKPTNNKQRQSNKESLKKASFSPARKRLVFDFKSVKDQLTDKIIDNIEGMCFGPKLENGKQSLLLISDNNFNSFGRQLTQLILMEIDFKD